MSNHIEVIKGLNQKVIAVSPLYKQFLGSFAGAVFLAQLLHWASHSAKDKFYKTDAQIMDETALSENELRSAKKLIKERCDKFIKITREGLPARTYYEIDWDKFIEVLGKFSEKHKTSLDDKSEQTSFVKSTHRVSLNPQEANSEIHEASFVKSTKHINENLLQHENTTQEYTLDDSTKILPRAHTHESDELPSFIDPDVWREYLAYKKERKEKLSQAGIRAKFSQWRKWADEGIDVNECIKRAMANEWAGVFKPKPNELAGAGLRASDTSRSGGAMSEAALRTLENARKLGERLKAQGVQ